MERGSEETRRLQHCLRDLAALSTLPAVWAGYAPLKVADSLAGVLRQLLDLEFIFIRVKEPFTPQEEDVVHGVAGILPGDQARAIGEQLASWLASTSSRRAQSVPCPIGGGSVQLTVYPLGCEGEVGLLAAASRRAAFPTEEDRLLLTVATNQAAMILRRTQSEESVRRSEAAFRAIVSQAAAGIAQTDLEGRFVFVNATFAQLVGYPAAELRELRLQDITHPEDLPRNLVLFDRAVAEGTDFVIEKRYVRKDGSHVWVNKTVSVLRDGEGKPAGMLVVALDISLRKQAERHRTARHAVTQLLAHSASFQEAAPLILRATGESLAWDIGVLWTVDAGAGVLRCADIWTQPALRVAEFTADCRQQTFTPGVGLPGRIWASGKPEWIPDVSRDANFPRLRTAAAEGLHGGFGFPLLLDAELFGVVEFFSREVRQPDEDLLEMTATLGSQIGQFIKRRQAEEALQDASRRKDEFLATLAHELRNPLAPLHNGLALLRRAHGDREILDHARGTMERQLRQLVRLVDDLLDISRISRGKIELRKERVELAGVVQNAVETSRPLIEKYHHELTVTLPDRAISLEADAVRLGQILSNLLNNAAKYTEPHGRIWLTVEPAQREVAIRVRDTGIGIPADLLPRIFDLYVQAESGMDRAKGGLGIGLSLVRSLVELHGGSVAAASAGPGQGSEFTVRLPILPERPTREPHRPPPAARRSMPGRRILVVDDNVDAARSLALLLRLENHQVRVVHEGQAALEAVRDQPPEVVFLDIGLPGMDGYQVARQLRQLEAGPRLVLIAVTGWGQEEDRRLSREAGFDHHLTKPVDLEELHQLLARSVESGSGEPAP